jgi:hypothetical protein
MDPRVKPGGDAGEPKDPRVEPAGDARDNAFRFA